MQTGLRWPAPIQTVLWGLRQRWFFDHCRRRFGNTFTLRFFGQRTMLVVSESADLKALFSLNAHDFCGGADRAELLEPILGSRSLLFLDGDEHRHSRRRLQHAFRAERLDAYRDVIVEAAERDVLTWPVGEPFAVHPHACAVTLDVILRVVFGAGAASLGGLRKALAVFLEDTSGSPLVLVPPFRRELGGRSTWARFVSQRDAVRAELHAVVRDRRAFGPTGGTDMLSALLEAGDVADEHLVDDLMTFVLAGHDTTASTLAWIVDLLTHEPATLTRLRDSLAHGDEYLDAVIHEGMRMRPVITEVARTLLRPLELHGEVVPAGTNVLGSIHLAHTDPQRYPEPHAFRPERFLDQPADLCSWLPFGGGVRRCIGAAFAMLELREVLRVIVTSADLCAAEPGLERPYRRAVTLAPKHGTRVVLRAAPVVRNATAASV